MRIALFTECYRPIVNGVVISVATFAGELRKQGHEVQIIAPAYPGYADADAHVHRLPSISPPTSPRYPLAIPYTGYRLKPLFEEHPPDIIHVQHPFMCCREGRRWARHLGCPLVFTYHTLIRAYAHYVPLPQVLVRAAAVRVSRNFSNSVDRVVVPTRGVEDVLRSYGVRTPIDAIPTGIDLDLVLAPERTPVRATLGIPAGVPLIAYSGRIALEKNLETLIRAFATLVRGGSEAHLVLIGGGPWENECRRVMLSEGVADRVHLTGYLERDGVFDWLADSNAYAFPSLTDTQGVAVLEAMALGCPPVALRSGAVEDVIRDATDGLMVEATAESLAEGLAKVLGDDGLRRRLAGHARKRAEDFSAARMAERLVRVYEEALSG
ncbi:MAG: glycosyltransferase [Armatimonadetes bacterium]|nr:glycosyltransferase [Armatimonadota bacterium]